MVYYRNKKGEKMKIRSNKKLGYWIIKGLDKIAPYYIVINSIGIGKYEYEILSAQHVNGRYYVNIDNMFSFIEENGIKFKAEDIIKAIEDGKSNMDLSALSNNMQVVLYYTEDPNVLENYFKIKNIDIPSISMI